MTKVDTALTGEKRPCRPAVWRILLQGLLNTFLWLTVVYFIRIRPWHLRWGATDEEVNGVLPGDELLPNPKVKATHAITINVPAAQVWPWLVQLGWGRGGFYSYTFIENRISESFQNAESILPQFQQLEIGDSIPLAPAGEETVSLPVALLEWERTLVLHGDTRNEPDSPLVKPGDYLHVVWGFHLNEQPDGTTRLVERFQADYNGNLHNRLFYRVFLEPGSFVMERKMLLGIKQRAEARKPEVVSLADERVPV